MSPHQQHITPHDPPVVVCTGCRVDFDTAVGLARECQCSSREGSDVAPICVYCCAESAEPCEDAIYDVQLQRTLRSKHSDPSGAGFPGAAALTPKHSTGAAAPLPTRQAG